MVRFENGTYFHVKKFLCPIDSETRMNYNSKHITKNKVPSTNAKMNKWDFYNLIAFYRRHSDEGEIAFSIIFYCSIFISQFQIIAFMFIAPSCVHIIFPTTVFN